MNMSQISTADTEKQPIPYNEHSVEFLLAEYDRLNALHTETGSRAFRRFEFYVTIVSAALGAFLLISQAQASISVPEYVVDLFALGLLGYGFITYFNLTFASVFQLEVVRAIKRIQKYFVDRDAYVGQHLYFNTVTKPRREYRLARVLTRGIAGGSEKTVIAFINSIFTAYLLSSLLINYFGFQFSTTTRIVIAVSAFLITGIAHGVYVAFMYRATWDKAWSIERANNGVQPTRPAAEVERQF